MRARRAGLLGSGALLAAGCSGTLPPLRGQMEVGRDAYAIFVAGGGPAGGDLYAVRTEGGPVIPVTFTNVGEMRPALSPDGSMTAFLRGASLRDSTPGSVWVMNLLSGGEREIRLPRAAGTPRQVGWARDGRSLVVAAASGLYRANAPPASAEATPVTAAERAGAESTLAVLLGSPVFGRVVPCKERRRLCVVGAGGSPEELAQGARDAVRWGTDSVAFFVGAVVEVRPLGPGRARQLAWDDPPPMPRQMTVFLGAAERP